MICEYARVNSDSRDTLGFRQCRREVQISRIWNSSVQVPLAEQDALNKIGTPCSRDLRGFHNAPFGRYCSVCIIYRWASR